MQKGGILSMRLLTSVILYVLSMQLTMADPAEKSITLTIDLQMDFHGQLVTVQVDGGNVVNNEKITTNPVLGFAKRYIYKTSEGLKKIEINVIDGNKKKNFKQELIFDTDTAIGIQYLHNLDGQDIALTLSRRHFMYD
jgi:hypothetical protein